MKTKEEILSEFGCPDIPFDENVTMYYPAILSAMDEYAESKAKEAWNAARISKGLGNLNICVFLKYEDYEDYKTKQNA